MAAPVEVCMEEVGQKRRIPPKEKRPNTTLKRFLTFVLPRFCIRFLYSRPEEFIVSKLLLGAGFGSFMGIGLYYLLVNPMALYERQKTDIFYIIVGVFAIGWGTSTYFRCITLILVPNAFGKEGSTLLLIYVTASIYAGPVANLKQNMEEALRSISCIADLQIEHTKLVWDAMTTPLQAIADDLVRASKELRRDSDKIKKLFKETEDEMESTEGYHVEKEKELEQKMAEKNTSLTTQQKFDFKTMLRCEYVIEKGVEKCHDWFDKKHEDCMSVIKLPILNTLLCLPMKFTFLCNILNVVNVWCKNNLPFGGNFGDLYDMVNATVINLTSSFSIKKNIIIRQVFVGLNITEKLIGEEIKENSSRKKVLIEKAKSVMDIILSCSFIFLFFTAFDYTRNYNTDLLCDNFYVTTYFMQMDAHRRKDGERHLLPLLKCEKADFVLPRKVALHGPELKIMMKEFLACLPVLALLILAIIFDRTFFNLLHIIWKHSQVSYTFSSHHRLEIFVGGETIVAQLLRHTISALNSSSATLHLSNFTECLPQPVSMGYQDYLRTCIPALSLLPVCIIHVYCYRLRRVVAAFFFPKREKARVIFLYNMSLKKRDAYANIMAKRVWKKSKEVHQVRTALMNLFPWMRVIIRRRCIVCDESESRSSYVCPTTSCDTVYCKPCWRAMRRICYACTTGDQPMGDPSGGTK